MDLKDRVVYKAAADNTANSGNSVIDIKDLVDVSNLKIQ